MIVTITCVPVHKKYMLKVYTTIALMQIVQILCNQTVYEMNKNVNSIKQTKNKGVTCNK